MGLTSLPPIWTMSVNVLFVFFDGTPYDAISFGRPVQISKNIPQSLCTRLTFYAKQTQVHVMYVLESPQQLQLIWICLKYFWRKITIQRQHGFHIVFRVVFSPYKKYFYIPTKERQMSINFIDSNIRHFKPPAPTIMVFLNFFGKTIPPW